MQFLQYCWMQYFSWIYRKKNPTRKVKKKYASTRTIPRSSVRLDTVFTYPDWTGCSPPTFCGGLEITIKSGLWYFSFAWQYSASIGVLRFIACTLNKSLCSKESFGCRKICAIFLLRFLGSKRPRLWGWFLLHTTILFYFMFKYVQPWERKWRVNRWAKDICLIDIIIQLKKNTFCN